VRRLALLVAPAVLACCACGGGSTPPKKGDAQHGEQVFAEKCASCHGQGGSGGTAPKLAGTSISTNDARNRIENGASGMPADLVGGQDEEDVLAYLQQIGSG
jgi:mono/diheme cytochrome c family protein